MMQEEGTIAEAQFLSTEIELDLDSLRKIIYNLFIVIGRKGKYSCVMQIDFFT